MDSFIRAESRVAKGASGGRYTSSDYRGGDITVSGNISCALFGLQQRRGRHKYVTGRPTNSIAGRCAALTREEVVVVHLLHAAAVCSLHLGSVHDLRVALW